jgi:hypothetical protein
VGAGVGVGVGVGVGTTAVEAGAGSACVALRPGRGAVAAGVVALLDGASVGPVVLQSACSSSNNSR